MINVQTWQGSGSIKIIDMTNAGKRGKRCATLHFNGWRPASNVASYDAINNFTTQMLAWAEALDTTRDFEQIAYELAQKMAHAPSLHFSISRDEMRSIDTPKTLLTAGVEGKWSASADETGISLHDLADTYNEWTEITSRQTKGAAYAIAVKVWDKVQACKTLSEASDVLTNAGAKLHGYCAVD